MSPLSTWKEPAKAEIGLQFLVCFKHSLTVLSHLYLAYCSPYPSTPKINSAL